VKVDGSSSRNTSSSERRIHSERSTTEWRRPTTSNATRTLRDPSADTSRLSLHRRGVIPKNRPSKRTSIRLLVGIDGAFIFRPNCFSIAPLPVVVAVVVDFLDRDRRFRGDVIREVIGTLVDLVFLIRLCQPCLSFLVLSEFVGVSGDVLELLGGFSLSVSISSVGNSDGGVGGS
jgi:hypothetical protein